MEKATRLLRQNKLSLIVTALACLFTLILWPLTQRYPFALFIAAVLLTAWQEGPKSAVVTTGLSSFSLIILCYFIPSATGGGSGWEHLANQGGNSLGSLPKRKTVGRFSHSSSISMPRAPSS